MLLNKEMFSLGSIGLFDSEEPELVELEQLFPTKAINRFDDRCWPQSVMWVLVHHNISAGEHIN